MGEDGLWQGLHRALLEFIYSSFPTRGNNKTSTYAEKQLFVKIAGRTKICFPSVIKVLSYCLPSPFLPYPFLLYFSITSSFLLLGGDGFHPTGSTPGRMVDGGKGCMRL